jgi:hypothetical protein
MGHLGADRLSCLAPVSGLAGSIFERRLTRKLDCQEIQQESGYVTCPPDLVRIRSGICGLI